MKNSQMVEAMAARGYCRDQQSWIRGEKAKCGWGRRWMALKEGQNCVIGANKKCVYYRVPELEDEADNRMRKRVHYLEWCDHVPGDIKMHLWLKPERSRDGWTYMGKFMFGPAVVERHTVVKQGKTYYPNRMRTLILDEPPQA
jgi:hypothetical protein